MEAIDVNEYVVIDDGAFQYPILIDDLDGQTQASLKAMRGPDEYSLWCSTHPMDSSRGTVGTQGCIDFCEELKAAGAAVWRIG